MAARAPCTADAGNVALQRRLGDNFCLAGWRAPLEIGGGALINCDSKLFEGRDTGRQGSERGNHEIGHSPQVHRNPGDLQLRKHIRHLVDRGQAAACGSLLGLPPFLYRQAEGHGYRGPDRQIPPALRIEVRSASARCREHEADIALASHENVRGGRGLWHVQPRFQR